MNDLDIRRNGIFIFLTQSYILILPIFKCAKKESIALIRRSERIIRQLHQRRSRTLCLREI